MKATTIGLVLWAGAIGPSLAVQAQDQAAPKRAVAAEAKDHAADETAIRASVDAFTKAYNRHDAAAIVALFYPNAKLVDEEGAVVEGQDAIAEVFSTIFAEQPETQIEVAIESIKFIGSDLAVEIGTTKTTPAPGEPAENGRYTVLHLKRDGKWRMALARDNEGEQPTNHERLQPLEWMVGDWIDEAHDSVVMTSCRWSDDGNYLLQDIQVRIAGRRAMNVSQRIGWDPLTKQIKSWVFDTDGGYGEGLWARDGESWIIKSTGVLRDGGTASASTSITPQGNDAYLVQSSDRVVGGELTPPLEIRVVRKPPTPATASTATESKVSQ
jgi:uncharacterized protein (TIGR02246 family)